MGPSGMICSGLKYSLELLLIVGVLRMCYPCENGVAAGSC